MNSEQFYQLPLRRQLGLSAKTAIALAAGLIITEWYAVSPIGVGGSGALPGIHLIFMMPTFAAILGLFISPFCLPFRQVRRKAFSTLICCILFLAIVIPIGRLAGMVRTSAFQRLAKRCEPLVAAIQKYSQERGKPPESLHELVPRYLPAIPTTGMPAYPKFEYRAGREASEWAGNPWVLYVNTPSTGLNWDRFLYFPLQNYPSTGYGGSLERMGSWVYVHE